MAQQQPPMYMAAQPLPKPPSLQRPPPMHQLQSMLNAVLVHTGRVISERSQRRLMTQRILPELTSRYHDTLDEIENELHRSKAIMRRDYAIYQAARARRERAEAAERERVEAAKAAGTGTGAETDIKDTTHGIRSESNKVDDVEMADASPDSGIKLENTGLVASNIKTESSQNANGTGEGAEKTDDAPTTAIGASTSFEDAILKTPTTAGDVKDIDFESMFEDFTGSSVNNDATQTSTGMDLTSFASGASGGAPDVPSLLPDSDGFAGITESNLPETTGADAANLDASLDLSVLDLPTQVEDSEPKQKGASTNPNDSGDILGEDFDMGDSNFDELFNYEFNVDDDGGGGSARREAGGDGGDASGDFDWMAELDGDKL